MRKFIFTLATMVLGLVPSMAQNAGNSLYMADATATAGAQVTLSFNVKNSVDVQALQVDFTLPEGFSVVYDAEYESYLIDLSTERTTYKFHSLSCNLMEGGFYRVGILSPQGRTFKGNDGEVFTATVSVDKNVKAGDYTVEMLNITLANVDGKVIEDATATGKITVAEPTGIQQVMSAVKNGEVWVYNVNGVLLPAPQKGINIVKNVQTGEMKKIVIK